MSESTLAVSRTDLRAAVGFYLGYTRTSSNWTTEAAAQIDDSVLSGVRRFYFPETGYVWKFLYPASTLTLNAAYSTGTIAVTISTYTVTLTSGTFPTWAASGVFTAGGRSYEISTRDSGTQITLATAYLGATETAATYIVDQRDYDLPDNFGSMRKDFTYPSGAYYGQFTRTDELTIRSMRNAPTILAYPSLYAIRGKLTAGTSVGQRFEVMFYPAVNVDVTVDYVYSVIPDNLSASILYPYGGAKHAETLFESCIAVAEERYKDNGSTTHQNAFVKRLGASMEFDKDDFSPSILAYNNDPLNTYGTDGNPYPLPVVSQTMTHT